MREPITITDARRHGVPDWVKAVIIAIVGMIVINVAFDAGKRRGHEHVWIHTIRCGPASCNDYWTEER